jgi:hypothetical protein
MANIVDYNPDTGVVTLDDGSSYNTKTNSYTPSDTPAEPEVWRGNIDYRNSDFANGIIKYTSGITYNLTTNEYTYPDVYPDNVEYQATLDEYLAYIDTNPNVLPSTILNSRYANAAKEYAKLNYVPTISSYFDSWNSLLSGSIESDANINRRDDVFNKLSEQAPGITAVTQFMSPEEIRTVADLPDHLSIFDDYQNTSDIITSETVSDAYWTLLSGDGPEAALSEYYGTDIKLGDTTGSNYKNINKYGDMDEEEFKQFQSIMKPILEMSVPYAMVTQGFDYNSAVEYVYTHDPMAAAVYTLYGVDLYRQTDDGSTYIYDPIQGQEIRTLEVKDVKFEDLAFDIVQAAVLAVATAGMGDYFANMYADAGLSATSSRSSCRRFRRGGRCRNHFTFRSRRCRRFYRSTSRFRRIYCRSSYCRRSYFRCTGRYSRGCVQSRSNGGRKRFLS